MRVSLREILLNAGKCACDPTRSESCARCRGDFASGWTPRTEPADDAPAAPPAGPVLPAEWPVWFASHVLRTAAYSYSAARMRLQRRDVESSGDVVWVAIHGEALALRERFGDDTSALMELYWPVSAVPTPLPVAV